MKANTRILNQPRAKRAEKFWYLVEKMHEKLLKITFVDVLKSHSTNHNFV